MNGRTHAAIGLTVPLGALATGTPLAEATVIAAVATAFAIAPDIDHPRSTITKALPSLVHRLTVETCSLFWQVTATGRDRRSVVPGADCPDRSSSSPLHRTLTHTALAAVSAAGMAYAIGHLRYGAAALAVLSVYACRNLFPWRLRAAALGAALAVALFAGRVPVEPAHLAMAAGAGWMSHVLADACTTRGVPLLWPMTIKGKRWWYVRALGGWLRSGERKEVLTAGGVAIVTNIPYLMFAWGA